MPHFFLNIRDGDHVIEDTIGADFIDVEHAREQARQAAKRVLAKRSNRNFAEGEPHIELCDAGGHVLVTIALSDLQRRRTL